MSDAVHNRVKIDGEDFFQPLVGDYITTRRLSDGYTTLWNPDSVEQRHYNEIRSLWGLPKLEGCTPGDALRTYADTIKDFELMEAIKEALYVQSLRDEKPKQQFNLSTPQSKT